MELDDHFIMSDEPIDLQNLIEEAVLIVTSSMDEDETVFIEMDEALILLIKGNHKNSVQLKSSTSLSVCGCSYQGFQLAKNETTVSNLHAFSLRNPTLIELENSIISFLKLSVPFKLLAFAGHGSFMGDWKLQGEDVFTQEKFSSLKNKYWNEKGTFDLWLNSCSSNIWGDQIQQEKELVSEQAKKLIGEDDFMKNRDDLVFLFGKMTHHQVQTTASTTNPLVPIIPEKYIKSSLIARHDETVELLLKVKIIDSAESKYSNEEIISLVESRREDGVRFPKTSYNNKKIKSPLNGNGIYLLNAGSGNCSILCFGEQRIIFDYGRKSIIAWNEFITKYCKQVIIFLSHSDEDHIIGAKKLISHIRLNPINSPKLIGVYMNPYDILIKASPKIGRTNEQIGHILNDLKLMNNPAKVAKAGSEFTFDHIKIKIILPKKTNINDPNDQSLVALVTAGDKKLLFTGDAHYKDIYNELESLNLFPLALYYFEVPHHGSSKNFESHQWLQDTFFQNIKVTYFGILTDCQLYDHPDARLVEILQKKGTIIANNQCGKYGPNVPNYVVL